MEENIDVNVETEFFIQSQLIYYYVLINLIGKFGIKCFCSMDI